MKVLGTRIFNKATKHSSLGMGLYFHKLCDMENGCLLPLPRMPSIVDIQKRKEKRAADVEERRTGMSAKKPKLHVSLLHVNFSASVLHSDLCNLCPSLAHSQALPAKEGESLGTRLVHVCRDSPLRSDRTYPCSRASKFFISCVLQLSAFSRQGM